MKTKEILIGLFIALFLAVVLSSFASSFPDGLERVAEKLGFLEKGEGEPLVAAPAPDYTFPLVNEESPFATPLAGLVGTLVVFMLGVLVAWGCTGTGRQETGGKE